MSVTRWIKVWLFWASGFGTAGILDASGNGGQDIATILAFCAFLSLGIGMLLETTANEEEGCLNRDDDAK